MGLEMEETANDERMKNELIESAKGKAMKIHEKSPIFNSWENKRKRRLINVCL